jgi:hypothetical protein
MKKPLLLLAASCGTLLLGACVYDDDGYASRSVSVSTGDYYGAYDEYHPYYSHGGRRYYRSGDQYVYYSNRRPNYVTALPSRSVYVSPERRTTTRVSSEPYRSQETNRYADRDRRRSSDGNRDVTRDGQRFDRTSEARDARESAVQSRQTVTRGETRIREEQPTRGQSSQLREAPRPQRGEGEARKAKAENRGRATEDESSGGR